MSTNKELYEQAQEGKLWRQRYEWLLKNFAALNLDIGHKHYHDEEGHIVVEFNSVHLWKCDNCGKPIQCNHERLAELLDEVRALEEKSSGS